MLKNIWEVVKGIWTGITSLVTGLDDLLTFLWSMIEDLVYVVGLLGQIGGNIISWIGWLPSLVVSTVVVLVSLAIIFKVLGRE